MTVGPEALAALVEPVVEAAGFALVRVHVSGGARPTLQVMAEDPATGQLTLDQCAELSHALSPVLEAADPFLGPWRLEVSSPGIDRPLTRPEDFARFAPHRARVELASGIEVAGRLRRRFEGRLGGVEGASVRLEVEGLGVVLLPLDDVRQARLVLTDELLRAGPALDPTGADRIVRERLRRRGSGTLEARSA